MKVMLFGTFDIIHPGHLALFRQAKSFGDTIIVLIARDSTVQKIKGKMPKHNEKIRAKNIISLGVVNQVLLGDKLDPYKKIIEIKPDIICIGYDQLNFVDKLKGHLKAKGIDIPIKRLQEYKSDKYKSSKLA